MLRTVDEEVDRLATDGLPPGELARTQARMATHLLRDTDAVLGRAMQMAVLEVQRGDPGCSTTCPGWSARSPRSRSGRPPPAQPDGEPPSRSWPGGIL